MAASPSVSSRTSLGNSSNDTVDKGVKSPYKSLSKLAVPSTDFASSPRKFVGRPPSGLPRSPAPTTRGSTLGMVSPSGSKDSKPASSSSRRRKSENGTFSSSTADASANAGGSEDKLAKILALKNQWKAMKDQHEIAAQQASNRRVDLTKELF